MIDRILGNPYPLRYLLYKRYHKLKNSYSREHYYYCIETAASLAATLGIGKISIIEFGVAGGNGLIEIERICAHQKKVKGVDFAVYGFDTGQGLPPPVDHRDKPYLWQQGFFAMDVDALRARLRTSRLVLGNVRDTVPAFVAAGEHPPIGAVMFDLDYYSSTVDALGVFATGRPGNHLPRVNCYFDDIGGIGSVGPGLAIDEFNARHATMKIECPLSLKHGRGYRDWGWRVYEFHQFDHPLYDKPLVEDDQLPLA